MSSQALFSTRMESGGNGDASRAHRPGDDLFLTRSHSTNTQSSRGTTGHEEAAASRVNQNGKPGSNGRASPSAAQSFFALGGMAKSLKNATWSLKAKTSAGESIDEAETTAEVLARLKKKYGGGDVLTKGDIDHMWKAFSDMAHSMIGDLATREEDLGNLVLPFKQIDLLLADRTDTRDKSPALVSGLQWDIAEEAWIKLSGRGNGQPEQNLDFESYVQLVYDLKVGRIPESLRRKPLLPFNPEAAWKQLWDFMVMLFLFYTCFSVPYLLAFATEDSDVMTPFNIFDLSLDVIFMLDVFVSFVTAYLHQGVMVTDLRKIAVHYLQTWFLLDIAGSFPFDKVIVAASKTVQREPQFDLQSMRIFKAVRMLKLLRAAKFMDHLAKLEQREGFAAVKKTLRIMKSSFVMLFVAHLLGCLFSMLIDRDQTDNWLYTYDPDIFYADNWSRYMVALYWAIITVSTMGYGDVLPVNHEERMFAVFVAVFGAVVFSYCMGTMTTLITQSTGADARFDDMLRMVTEYLDFRKVPQVTKLKIKRHMHVCLRRSAPLYEEGAVLDFLPSSLRKELLNVLAINDAYKLPFFEGLLPECVGNIMTHLGQQIFEAGQVIYQAEEVGSDMYIVVHGSVTWCPHDNLRDDRLTPIDEDQVTHLEVGASFGEIGLFSEICRYRGETVIAKEETKVLVMSSNDLCLIGDAFPVVVEKIRNLCMLLALDRKLNNTVMETKIFQRYQGRQREGLLEKRVRELSDKLRAESRPKLLDEFKGRQPPPVYDVWSLVTQNKHMEPKLAWPETRPLNVFPSADDGEMWQRVSIVIMPDGCLRFIADTIQSLTSSEAATMGYLRADTECTMHKRTLGLEDNAASRRSRRRFSAKKLIQRKVLMFKVYREGSTSTDAQVVSLAADSVAELDAIKSGIEQYVEGLRRRSDHGSQAVERHVQALREDAHAAISVSVDDAEVALELRDVRVHAQDYPAAVLMGSAGPPTQPNREHPGLHKTPSSRVLGALELDAQRESAASRQEVQELKALLSGADERVGIVEHKVDTLVRKMDLVLVKLNAL